MTPIAHRAVPSLRYIVHLAAPGLDIIGAGEPALPGVSIGHNGTVAFGLTIFSIDQEDLYVYETHPENPELYRYRDRFESVTVLRETVEVRGEPDAEVELRFTRHGPVLYEDPENHRMFALKAAWLEPGMAPYLGSIEYMRARNWDEFVAAMNRWGAPSENQVFADTTGRIGWKPGGRAPIRPNWDGLLPVPGDGRYEWAGYLDMDRLPVIVDPPSGFVATANQMNLPTGYSTPLGYEWASPWRHERIVEVLSEDTSHTVADSLVLQDDAVSLPARRLLESLRAATATPTDQPTTKAQRRALELLLGWDGDLRADSASAALFEIWWRNHLPKAAWGEIVGADPSDGLGAALADEASRGNLLDLVAPPSGAIPEVGAQSPGLTRAQRRRVLLSSLESAWQEARKLLGKRAAAWQWGDLHRISLVHPALEHLSNDLRRDAELPSRARSGSGETVGNTGYRGQSYEQVSGASFRMVLDVGNWDASIAMNNPGQSGDPRSPHYRDLLEPWSNGEAFPLLYSREKVLGAATRRITLAPTNAR